MMMSIFRHFLIGQKCLLKPSACFNIYLEATYNNPSVMGRKRAKCIRIGANLAQALFFSIVGFEDIVQTVRLQQQLFGSVQHDCCCKWTASSISS